MKRLLFILLILCFLIGNTDAAAKKKNETLTMYRYSISFAYSPVNNLFEDDNIILQIYNGSLWAKNKSDRAIFIDLSQCFLINNGSSYPMYTKATNENFASRAKFITEDAYISIAPATGSDQNFTHIAKLNDRIFKEYSSIESSTKDFSEYDKRFLNLINDILKESLEADPKGKEYLGTVNRHLTEDESISNIGASIAYSFNKNAEDWKGVTISTWVSDIIFAPYYTETPAKLKKKEKKGFDIKKTDPIKIHVKGNNPFEYDEDKSPIIIADWEGNFKKGTFKLLPIVKKAGGFNPEVMKSVIIYDGIDSDWGVMIKGYYGYTAQK